MNTPVSSKSSPLEQLQVLASLSLGDTAIEQPERQQEEWRGFTFSIDNLNLVFPFMGGFEILPEREIHAVPWVQPWVRGVTNVRGDVYSVVDIGAYFGLTPVRSVRSATLFMLPDTQLKSVILLDSKVALKSFPDELEHIAADDLPSRLLRCRSASVVLDDEVWHAMDVNLLCHDQDFVTIAIETEPVAEELIH